MKIYAKAYKTYEGARRRLLFERAQAKKHKRWVWDIHVVGSHYHLVRFTSAERDRAIAVQIAKQAFGL